jgi:hypothetical protein
MSEQVSLRDFFDEKFSHLTTQINGVAAKADTMIEKQDLTNGRVRKAELAIAVLAWAYGVGAAVIGWLVVTR